ncbi:MAG: NUDIX hydrolase [Candidatus Coprovivens sp.]
MENDVIKVFRDSDFGIDVLESKDTKLRKIVKGIIIDKSGSVALFNKRVENDYSLPGGAIAEGDKPEIAFLREIKRKFGCDVEVIRELGVIEEHMGQDDIIQKTYVFVGRVLEKGKIDYCNQELDEFGKVLWVAPEEALKIMSDYKKEVDNGEIENLYHVKYSVYRDEFIVRYYLINFVY